jgi:signal transduction histidine kinase
MMKVYSVLIILFFTSVFGQTNIDSLISVYPTQSDAEKAKTLSELCYILSFSDLEESLKYGKLAHQAAEKSGDLNLISRTLSDWSIPLINLGKFDTAIVLNRQVLEIETKEGDSIQVAATLNKLATAAFKLGKYDLSVKYSFRALPIFEANNYPSYVGATFNLIANSYEANKMHELALTYYGKAKRIAEETNDQIGFSSALNNEGLVLLNLKRHDEAEVKLIAANKIIQELDLPEKLGFSYQTLGLNALQDNRPAEAKSFYQKAYEIFEELGNLEGKCLINVNLAECLIHENKIDSADWHIQNSIAFAKETNSIFLLKSVYKSAIRLENLKGNSDKADAFFQLYETLNDSIYSAATNASIAEMQVKYDTEQKTLELAQEKLSRKNTQLWLLIAVTLLVLFGVLILYVRYRKRLAEEKLKLAALESLEQERSRIARDLHDNLGADLTLIASKVDIQAFKQKDENFKGDLEQISAITQSANAQLRDTIWSIHKSALNLGELNNKIDEFVRRTFDADDHKVKVECNDAEKSIPPTKALHLYRITQEFVNNSFKYAQCDEIKIELKKGELKLKDNGIGFDFDTVSKGYGLNNIHARGEEMNAQLTWKKLAHGIELVVHY